MDLPYRITRELLQDFANADVNDKLFKKLRVTGKARPGSILEAVSAYPSFDAFSKDVSQAGAADPRLDGQSPLIPIAVFGWKFFVPDGAELGEDEDRRLLEKAIKLAAKTEFVERREDFYKWWADVVEGEISLD